jgi:hypothetical protein
MRVRRDVIFRVRWAVGCRWPCPLLARGHARSSPAMGGCGSAAGASTMRPPLPRFMPRMRSGSSIRYVVPPSCDYRGQWAHERPLVTEHAPAFIPYPIGRGELGIRAEQVRYCSYAARLGKLNSASALSLAPSAAGPHLRAAAPRRRSRLWFPPRRSHASILPGEPRSAQVGTGRSRAISGWRRDLTNRRARAFLGTGNVSEGADDDRHADGDGGAHGPFHPDG